VTVSKRVEHTARDEPIRVAMFTELTRKNGSSRVVCFQFENEFRKQGLDVRFYPPSPVRLYEALCERLRGPRLLSLVSKGFYWYAVVLPVRLAQIALAVRSDVVFVQRGLFRHDAPPVLEIVLWLVVKKLFKRVVVYALDDAQYLYNPPWYFTLRFRLADWGFTGNEHIAEFARSANPRVKVIESVVDPDHFRPRVHIRHKPVIVGWAGTLLDGKGPLPIVERALATLSIRRPGSSLLHTVSNRPYEPEGDRCPLMNSRWRLEDEAEVLRSFDIGVMPLSDDEFSRAKEGYKLKQYMAAGLPVVCSPVGKNKEIVEDGVTGYWAGSEDEWVDRLDALIRSRELREKMGHAGREKVVERYSLRRAGPEMSAWLKSLALERRAGKCGQLPGGRERISRLSAR
jgi:glycosyltransferase involved in cell wall biosynthesis